MSVDCGNGRIEEQEVEAVQITDPAQIGAFIAAFSGLGLRNASAEDAELFFTLDRQLTDVALFGSLYQFPTRTAAGDPIITAGGVPVGSSSAMALRGDVWGAIRAGRAGSRLPGRPRLQACQVIGHEGMHLVLNARGDLRGHGFINPFVSRMRC